MKPMIPSMGGREMGPVYARYIETMPYGLDVVEVGAWLGAGTYELAAAMRDNGHTRTNGGAKDESSLHCYDWFVATKQCIGKAAGVHKYRPGIAVDGLGDSIKLTAGQDTLPLVRKYLYEFPFIQFHKGDINNLEYSGHKIGVLVVDAAKRGPSFRRLMAKLEPHLVTGATVFFMDYWFDLYKPGAGTSCQAEYVKASGKYTHLKSYKELCCEVMVYG